MSVEFNKGVSLSSFLQTDLKLKCQVVFNLICLLNMHVFISLLNRYVTQNYHAHNINAILCLPSPWWMFALLPKGKWKVNINNLPFRNHLIYLAEPYFWFWKKKVLGHSLTGSKFTQHGAGFSYRDSPSIDGTGIHREDPWQVRMQLTLRLGLLPLGGTRRRHTLKDPAISRKLLLLPSNANPGTKSLIHVPLDQKLQC